MGAAPSTKRRLPRRRDTRAAQLAAADKAVAAANKLSNEDFASEFIKPSDASWPAWTHPQTQESYTLSLRSPEDMDDGELTACFDIVEQTSGDDYRGAAGGWHPLAKRAEMRSPGLRYILVTTTNHGRGAGGADQAQGEIRAFTSFMPTFEDSQPVVYCYEIHLLPEMERAGLGKILMDHVTTAADNIPTLEKTMLTCFVSNAHARRFYEKLGFDVDQSSPRPRRLRDKVIEPEYVILCRRTNKGADQTDGGEHQEKRTKNTAGSGTGT
ncbi:hypothetical protein LMH87_006123 [Akanthomyces muscarius]|uniref:N-alpha-acetyltransferase 40 n=1 Tax=Akanthomyces muscarius TaxID=2231603 RepID=A0A9W8QQI6_AKAMU|nr:hypothetical protein LMH87_006123 [Akanthomyces muscarius]KAJ4164447.1 hypothetical protein LMH87_006123 [Akanthomyces muscarius]